MRVTDDRYRRERRAFDLAWRMIGLSARTSTISHWTGLAERRIRTLQQSYGRDLACALHRPRGSAPRRIGLLLRSSVQRQWAAQFADLCCRHHVLPAGPLASPDRSFPTISRGESLCTAFEEFQAAYPGASLTIDQAILLLTELARRELVDLGCCPRCKLIAIVDRLSQYGTACLSCHTPLPPSTDCGGENSTENSNQGSEGRKMVS